MKNMVCNNIHFVWIALFLLVSTNNIRASALEKSEPNQTTDLIQFKALQQAIKEGKYSEGLKEFCDKSEIGKIYTYSYYKKSGPSKTKEGYLQLLKAKYLYESLAEISLDAAKEEIDLQESIKVLEQLTRLREALLKDEDIGTFNIKIDHAVSGIISGLIIHIASKSTNSELDKIKPFIKSWYPSKKYNLKTIKAIMKSENIYDS